MKKIIDFLRALIISYEMPIWLGSFFIPDILSSNTMILKGLPKEAILLSVSLPAYLIVRMVSEKDKLIAPPEYKSDLDEFDLYPFANRYLAALIWEVVACGSIAYAVFSVETITLSIFASVFSYMLIAFIAYSTTNMAATELPRRIEAAKKGKQLQ